MDKNTNNLKSNIKIMKLLNLSIALLLSIVFITSCTKKDESLKHLPKTADMVFTFNPQQLQEKSEVKNIAETKAYKNFTKNITAEESEHFQSFDYIFKDSDESGIDLAKNVFFFENNQHNGYNTSVGVNFMLANSTKFTAMIEKIVESKSDSIEIVVEDGINYLIRKGKESKSILAWNETTVVAIHQTKGRSNIKYLKENTALLINQKTSNSLASNKDFSEFYSKRKDINLWLGSDFLLSKIPQEYRTIVKMQSPIKLKDIGYHHYIDFQNGNAIMESELILPDDLKSLVEEFHVIKENFDEKMLTIIPQKSLFNLSFAVDPYEFYRMIKKLYAERQVDTKGMEQLLEASTDIKLEKVLKAFAGEVIINVHDIKLLMVSNEDDTTANPTSHTETKFLYSVAVKLDDEEVYNWAVKQFSDNEPEMVDGYYVLFDEDGDNYIAMLDNYLLLTNDKNVIVNFTTKKKLKPSLADSDIGTHLRKYPVYARINMDYSNYSNDIQNFFDTTYNDDLQMKNKLSEIIYEPESSYRSEVSFSFKDKNTNSLKQILN